MDEITLTYRAWRRIDPRYRNMMGGVPVAVVDDDGELVLVRVRFERQQHHLAQPCAAQLDLFAGERRSAT